MELHVRNINEAVSRGYSHIIQRGIKEDSRNGAVLVAPTPVMTVYSKPTERVLFSPLRDANPFFHLMESLWMLAGRDDLEFPQLFNSRFKEYSDNGLTVHGAYGHRWRQVFGYDQLNIIANELIKNPNSRRCVLAMWDASPNTLKRGEDGICTAYDLMNSHLGSDDLNLAVNGGKDVPCNTHIYFDVRDSKLNMTVCCRSNDIVWGAYGANAVHFSILQEYMAAYIGVEVGEYRQFSNNYHAYTDVYSKEKLNEIAIEAHRTDYYAKGMTNPYPLVSTPIDIWNADLNAFMSDPDGNAFVDPFFTQVAYPMYAAYMQRKRKQGDGMAFVEQIAANDWRVACTAWIKRREAKNATGA